MPYGVGVGMANQRGLMALQQAAQRAKQQQIAGLGQGVQNVGLGIQALLAKRKQEAEQQDIMNVLSGGEPTTAKGAELKYKMSGEAADRSMRQMGLDLEKSRNAREEGKVSRGMLQDELGQRREMEAREARQRGLAREMQVAPQMPPVGEGASLIGGYGELLGAANNMGLPPVEELEAMREVRGQRFGEDIAKRKLDISQQGMDIARQREGRLNQPEDETSRRTREAKMRKTEADADKAEREAKSDLTKEMGAARLATRSTLLTKAVDILKARKDEDDITIPFTKEDVINVFRFLNERVNREETSEERAKRLGL